MTNFPPRHPRLKTIFLGIAEQLAQGELPDIDGDALLKPAFRGFSLDPALEAWLIQEVAKRNRQQYTLTVSAKQSSRTRTFELTGPTGTQTVVMGPFDPGFRLAR